MIRRGTTGGAKELYSRKQLAELDRVLLDKLEHLESDFPYRERFGLSSVPESVTGSRSQGAGRMSGGVRWSWLSPPAPCPPNTYTLFKHPPVRPALSRGYLQLVSGTIEGASLLRIRCRSKMRENHAVRGWRCGWRREVPGRRVRRRICARFGNEVCPWLGEASSGGYPSAAYRRSLRMSCTRSWVAMQCRISSTFVPIGSGKPAASKAQ
jgi:hypothetical protein